MKANQLPDFARHDRAVCLAIGLFRSLRKGARKMEKLDVSYPVASGAKWQFRAPELLGVDDMLVLLAVVALASRSDSGGRLSPTPSTPEGVALRDGLALRDDASEQDARIYRGSIREIAQVIGLTESGNTFRRIRASLERIAEVTTWVEVPAKTGRGVRRASYRLISAVATDESTGSVAIGLNPDLTAAVLGKTSWCRLDLAAMRRLSTDTARLLYHHLSAAIDPGRTCPFLMDTLIEYVWVQDAVAEATRQRRAQMRIALAELGKIGWSVVTKGGAFEIGRPKAEPA